MRYNQPQTPLEKLDVFSTSSLTAESKENTVIVRAQPKCPKVTGYEGMNLYPMIQQVTEDPFNIIQEAKKCVERGELKPDQIRELVEMAKLPTRLIGNDKYYSLKIDHPEIIKFLITELIQAFNSDFGWRMCCREAQNAHLSSLDNNISSIDPLTLYKNTEKENQIIYDLIMSHHTLRFLPKGLRHITGALDALMDNFFVMPYYRDRSKYSSPYEEYDRAYTAYLKKYDECLHRFVIQHCEDLQSLSRVLDEAHVELWRLKKFHSNEDLIDPEYEFSILVQNIRDRIFAQGDQDQIVSLPIMMSAEDQEDLTTVQTETERVLEKAYEHRRSAIETSLAPTLFKSINNKNPICKVIFEYSGISISKPIKC